MKKKLKRLKQKIKKLKSKVKQLKSRTNPTTRGLPGPFMEQSHYASRDAERFMVDEFWPDYRGPNGS